MFTAWLAANGLRWAFYAALVASLVGFGAYRMHEHDQKRYDALQAEYVTFKAVVAAQGKIAQAAADKQKADDLKRKQDADQENAITVAGLNAELARVRKFHPAGSTVPASAPRAKRPDLACFDRAELNSAVDGLLGDLQGQAGDGAAATIDLDSAKRWGRQSRRPLTDAPTR